MELRKLVGHRPLILPGAVAIVLDAEDRILLQERSDGGWGLPGGLMELGESLEETARREVREETGFEIGELELVDVFSGAEQYLKIANGDELYSVTAMYVTKTYQGELVADGTESLQVRFFAEEELPDELAAGYRRFLERYGKWKKSRCR